MIKSRQVQMILVILILSMLCLISCAEIKKNEAKTDQISEMKPQVLGDQQINTDQQNNRSNHQPPPQTQQVVGVGVGTKENPFLNYPPNRTCHLPPPPAVGEMTLEPAFEGDLFFDQPLWMGYAPIPDQKHIFYVAQQGGQIYRVDSTSLEKSVFLDRRVNRIGKEEGLLSVAFHPKYPNSPYLFIYYSSLQCDQTQANRCTVLSRYQVQADLKAVDMSTEQRILEIEQPYANHNGGDLQFDQQGYLYLGLGDGGSANDPQANGQNTRTLLGSILRIDINGTDDTCARNYRIPPDNPFANNRCGADQTQAKPEIWAWGLRNPWRMSFDKETGELWVGDVGQDRFEEINLIQKAKNYGWNVMEGNECLSGACDVNAYEKPFYVYDHQAGKSITGGFVYRGSKWPALRGQYIYADFELGRVWALPIHGNTPTLLAQSEAKIASFGQDLDGELYLVSFDRPYLLKLVANQTEIENPIPQRLSQTGCFENIPNHQFATGVIPYQIMVPFYSDGVHKLRGIALAENQKIAYRKTGGFEFPLDTLLIKSFQAGQNQNHYIETRFLHKTERGWFGYSYEWLADQSDAILVEAPKKITLAEDALTQEWAFLSSEQCIQCHTKAGNYALGLQAQQLNLIIQHKPDRYYAQLRAWIEADFFDLNDPQSNDLLNLPTPIISPWDESQDLALRARTYLHINCSSCHQPNGVYNVNMDLRITQSLAQTNTCREEPLQGNLGIDQAKLIVPGDAQKSILYQRMSRRDEFAMPPMGSFKVDENGSLLVKAWIDQMQDCQ
jgi:uncharacterized repeat protein (TIGR03806 family)